MQLNQEGYNFPSFWDSVASSLISLRNDGIYTDVKIHCKGEIFSAHKLHLAATCPYFRECIGELKESTAVSIDLPIVEPKALGIILDILYTGKSVNVNKDHLCSVVEAAHLMQLNNIANFYLTSLLLNISEDSFYSIWDTAATLENADLLKAVYDYVLKEFLTLSESPKLHILSFERIKDVLIHVKKNLTPPDLILKCAIEWVCFDKQRRIFNLPNLLEFIPFEDISFSLMSNLLENCPLKEFKVWIETMHSKISDRQLLVSVLEKSKEFTIGKMHLFELDSNNKVTVQKLTDGKWFPKKILSNITAKTMTVVKSKEAFRIITREKDGNCFVNDVNYSAGLISRFRLGTISCDAKLHAINFGGMTVITAYPPKCCEIQTFFINGQIDIREEKITLSRTLRSSTLVKAQFVENGNFLQLLLASESDINFFIACFRYYDEMHYTSHPYNYWQTIGINIFPLAISQCSWYSASLPRSTEIFILPSKSSLCYCYDLSKGDAILDLPRCGLNKEIVALAIPHANTIVALDSEGFIYMNNITAMQRNWAKFSQCPELSDGNEHYVIFDSSN